MAPFSKVLVANRGEIAVRIFRTLRELGIGTVAVYSEVDRGSLHAGAADEAYLLGPGSPAESYLNQERILEVAARAGAEAIHPGYGFLAENATFARAVGRAGLVWIGPPADAIEVMGSKTAAREQMREAGVPVVPGTKSPVEAAEDVVRLGTELGWPLAIKAAAGGGGKGLKVVAGPDEAGRALDSARREGQAYFSDPTVYVERYLEDPRHVEVQVIAAGEPLWLRQQDVRLTGHAIECRINAEDASNGFLPSPGRITTYREPGGPGVRVDSGVAAGSEVPELYDPLMAKLVVHGIDREHARRRMLRALSEFEIGGITTLLGFHRALLEHPCFVAGETCHGVVESEELAREAEQLSHKTTNVQATSDGRLRERVTTVELDGRRFEVAALVPEPPHAELARRRRERTAGGSYGAARDAVVTPMQGTVLAVNVQAGEQISAGDVICVVEAMKMENEITAYRDGAVTELSVTTGQAVTAGQVICVVSQDDAN